MTNQSIKANKVKLEIKSNLEDLDKARKFVREIFSEISDSLVEKSRVDLIELAVNEVTANIIEHAYDEKPGNQIIIKAEINAKEIVFKFFDWGDSFDPKTVDPPAFDGSRDGGFGIYIITQAVDEFKYFRDEKRRNCSYLQIKI